MSFKILVFKLGFALPPKVKQQHREKKKVLTTDGNAMSFLALMF